MKKIHELTSADFVAPNGLRIVATAELSEGKQGITADETGWDYDDQGSDLCDSEGKIDGLGRVVWLDTKGNEWVWNGTGFEKPAPPALSDREEAMLRALRKIRSTLETMDMDLRTRTAVETATDAIEALRKAAPAGTVKP